MATPVRNTQATGNLLATRLGGGDSWRVAHVIFVNGCADSPRLPEDMKGIFAAPPPGEVYWGGANGDFVKAALEYFGAPRGATTFTNEPFGTTESTERAPNRPPNVTEYRGEFLHYLSAWDRRELGRRAYQAYWRNRNFGISDSARQRIAFVTHSMGAAYSHGLMEGIVASGLRIAYTVHINPFQAGAGYFRGDENGMSTAHVQTSNDPVVWVDPVSIGGLTDSWERIKARGWTPAASQILRDGPDDIRYAHAYPISQKRDFWFPNRAPAAFGLASAGGSLSASA